MGASPEAGLPGAAAIPDELRVFVSYDRESDGDLYDLLTDQLLAKRSSFRISAHSLAQPPTDYLDEALREAIRGADELVVLCGEKSDASLRMATELRIAQEEQRPYVLVWGRRELMCTMPTSVRPADGMYSWTWEILQTQVQTAHRIARAARRADGG